MFDLNKAEVNINCECGQRHTVKLEDAINRKVITCHCGTNIQLTDDGSVKKSVTDINRSFKDLENTLKHFGR